MRWLPLTLVFLFPALASAHLDLTEPPARYDRNELKDGPCGIAGGARGETVAVYEPGATIAITIEEYIDHPSHYRVAFDDDGDDDFRDPVCVDFCESGPQDPVFAPSEGGTILADVVPDDPAATQTIEVTLPEVECERCTLQVIQVMYDKKPITVGGNDIYYHCADIALRSGTGAPDLGPPSDGGSGGVDGGIGRMDAGTSASESGGCRASGEPSAAWLLFALSLVALRRRGGSCRRAASGSARANGRGRA